MGKETTTILNWNYTLPNLLNHLDNILASVEAKKKKEEILKKLNSSYFILNNSSLLSASSLSEKRPVHKPVFSIDTKTTMSPMEFVKTINASDFLFKDNTDPYAWPSVDTMHVPLNSSLGDFDNTWWLSGNDTMNFTSAGNSTNSTSPSTLEIVITSTVLGIMILTTVIGNVFVIAAILLERNLQQVANFLIVSLAVADLLVACLVMPLGAVYEISQEWALGPELCDMWTSSDVLCCTASILHLVAIALDRYWAVTYVDYIHTRNLKRILTMIFIVWMVSIVISIAPLFGWKDPEFSFRVTEQKKCLVSQDVAYQIFATMATFYVPLLVILILYWKIFQTARKRIHKRPGKNEVTQQIIKKEKERKFKGLRRTLRRSNGIPQQQTTAFTTEASAELCIVNERSSNNGAYSVSSEVSSRENILNSPGTPKAEPVKKPKKESLETKREKKAAKTLAVITGAFVICWLPFFVTALLMPICASCWKSDLMFSIFLWLGYFNSTLNPIIYTIFSPEFREAFKKILFGRKHQRYRPGKFR